MEIDIEQPIKKEGANFGTTYLDIIIIFLYDTVGQIKRQGHLDCIACMRKCKLKIEATAALKGVPSLV